MRVRLTANWRKVTRNVDNGRVTSAVRHKRGEVVDYPEEQLLHLLGTGGAVEVGEDEDTDGLSESPVTTEVSVIPTPAVPHGNDGISPSAESGQTADDGLRDVSVSQDKQSAGVHQQAGDAGVVEMDPDDVDSGDATLVPNPDADTFGSMEYGDLQQAASTRGIPANQKKEVLVAALREYTEQQNSGDNA